VKVLLDTNVILDYALERKPWFVDSEQILYLSEQKQIAAYVSASTISDIYYILRKIKGKELALKFIRNLINVCYVAKVDNNIIAMALDANFQDFEDAIQYSVAVINQLDTLVTRNIKDFNISKPKVLTPNQFIKKVE
jgi:predicted nucleic acid-binding protein